MSTHKHIDRICCVVLVVTLLITFLFMNGESLGVKAASAVMGYTVKLFDTSTVHTIDIEMDDWDEFIENCTSEEYYACTVIIDNEAYKNVAIRAKGNTSLTQVASYGNDRYSFKIEFDHYDSSSTYYGLDKLCLNNIIQDNTYMKDYLTYQMMSAFGVASPLCSYVYITVNGEDWGLYLAVEGIEESFLQRNYGKDYGELYKPDSQSMGGGRGNGKGFDMNDMEDFFGGNAGESSGGAEEDGMEQPLGDMGDMPDGAGENGKEQPGGAEEDGMEQPPGDMGDMPDGVGENGMEEPPEDMGDMPDGVGENGIEQPPGDMGDMSGRGGENGMSMGSDDVKLVYTDDEYDSYSNIFDNAKTDVTDSDKDRLIASLKSLNANEDIEDVVDVDAVIRYFVVHNFVLNFDSYTGSMIHNYYLYEKDGQMAMIPWDYNLAFGGFQSGADAAELVNYPIDSPVSGGTTDSRPMLNWIFENEEYTELYHQYFSEFISEYFESGYFSEMIDTVKAMISSYVEKDPTKFCTYEEFETGIDTLREFCLLRAESVSGQLDGTIGSTSEGQTQSSDALIDAGDISISDMGSMNNSMGDNGGPQADGTMGGRGGDFMQRPDGESDFIPEEIEADDTDRDQMPEDDSGFSQMPENDSDFSQMSANGRGIGQKPADDRRNSQESADGPDFSQMSAEDSDLSQNQVNAPETSQISADSQIPEGNAIPEGDAMPEGDVIPGDGGFGNGGNMENMPDMPDGQGQPGEDSMISWILLGGSVGILLAGLLFAALYNRRGKRRFGSRKK